MSAGLARAVAATPLLLSAQISLASEAPQEPLETVVVSAASGREQQALDIPQTIDVVSGDAAAAAQPTWIGEILNKLPGVYCTRYLSLQACVISLTDSLHTSLAAAWQDSEIIRDRPDGSDPRGVNGRTPRAQSDKLANLSLDWTPTLGSWDLAVHYDLQWLGSWWLDDQNTDRTPDEFISNVRVQVAIGQGWSLTAKALNLFDRRYAVTAVDEGFGTRYRPAEPRTMIGGVEYSF